MKRAPLLLPALLVAGCGRYAEFRLPELPPGAAAASYEWRAQPEPVLSGGVDALNPSVVEFRGALWNFYSVFDGKAWHTAAARSADGSAWTLLGPVLSPGPDSNIAANGSALVRQDSVWYWFQTGSPPRIRLARSSDGTHFQTEPQDALGLGPRGAWDERAVADPYVVEAGGRLYLYYLGEDRAHRQRLGLATSSDGIAWTKLRSNPILELGVDGEFDENGLGEPAVWAARGWYWMLYTGRDRKEIRRMGLARSRDGVRWERTGVLIAGEAAWDSRVVCDATVLVRENEVRVWFGGGDVAHPAENIHGKIGEGRLLPR